MRGLITTTSTFIGAVLLSSTLVGCEPTEATPETDPAVIGQLGAVEADLVALQDRLRSLETTEATLRARIDTLEADQGDQRALVDVLAAKDTIRDTLMQLASAIDSGDPSVLPTLLPVIADDFVLVAVDFGAEGQQDTLVFEGVQGLLGGFGPIMLEAQANLMPSAIRVSMTDAEHATATFKFANSVRPPSALGEEIDEKVLLFAAITAEFRFEGGLWKLVHLELLHSLAYPGTADLAH